MLGVEGRQGGPPSHLVTRRPARWVGGGSACNVCRVADAVSSGRRRDKGAYDDMPGLTRTVTIGAPAERVFSYVDDIRNLARHMSERGSTPLMGSKLKLEILTAYPSGVGATYRYTGRVMGLPIDFSETVTRFVAGREKVWQTIGEPRLLIIRSYEMRLVVEPLDDATARLSMTIDYTLPRSRFWGAVGRLLAPRYAAWCLDSMIRGTIDDLTRRVA